MPKIILLAFKATLIFIALLIVVLIIANMRFNQEVNKEIKELFKDRNALADNKIIKQDDIKHLPHNVQKWLANSHVIGKEKVTTVRLKQKGVMRIKEDGPWMKAEAEQYFTVDKPGFIWKAKVNMAPLFYFTGRDKYTDGRGNMQIKLLALLPVVNAQGKEIDQGTLLRFLGEMLWFPSAALSDYITWEEIDAHTAKATMSYNGVTASGIYTFAENGDVKNFTAKRYREVNGKFELDDWSVNLIKYDEFNGVRIPSKIDVTWKLKTGDFTWYKVEITEIDFNNPNIY